MPARLVIFLAIFGSVALTPGSSEQAVDRFDAWVAFVDKGTGSEADREAALRELEATFHPRALARRKLRRTRPGLFDEHDFLLCPEYLGGVRTTGAEVRVGSRCRYSGDYYREHGEADPLFVRGYGIPDMARALGLLPRGIGADAGRIQGSAVNGGGTG